VKLAFARVESWWEAKALMNVRNQCREGMTHDITEITEERQWKFWCDELKDGKTFEAYVLYDADEPIGYGLLKWDGERYWMTAGLTEAVRGKGLSRLIINFITEMGHREGREVWIDVYDDNLALFGDIRVGYQFVNSHEQPDGKILHIMRHQRDRDLAPREAEWMRERGHLKAPAPTPPSMAAQEMIEVDAISREAFPCSG
jgi:GNAT superfamily N-acetyltransferase